MVRRFALLPSLALVAAPAHADDPGAAERIKAALAVPAATPQPGCGVGIFRNGKPAERVNAGFADVEGGRPIRSDTQFYAASVSKQFTAVALMQQVVAGKVRLEDDIRTYIPELPQYAHPVTVQMLLNMTGGVRDSLALLGLEGYGDISEPSRASGLAEVYRQPDTKFEPGTRYDYTNGGYLLLSEIVERVTRMPFEAYVNANVLKPLGMRRSFVMLGSRTTDPNFAKGYVARGGTIASSNDYPLFGGSGGLITTVDDLGKWNYDIDTGHKVWTAEITRLMTMPGKFKNGAPALRGGWGITYGNALLIGPHWFHHTGAAGGFKTLFGYNAGKRIGIALLCNNGDYDPNEKADAVIAALAEGLPPVSEPDYPVETIDGRYKTPNLNATYVLAASSDGITIRIERPDGRPAEPMVFKRVQGQYRAGANQLMIDDDGKGFTLDIPRVSLHFDKVQ
ncbi:serine hydrolase domain-containing protein [Sphingomonas sp. dw_22]|uniref:serine hydrolase domain-containing protein n=1 Tax=Sphingomonas sp. dw_22 TaxID=2721175 RepID=UPI001BD3CE54|nr:serine hydrolase domain-containing protein [Sphingomonas sp. dw_22]